MRPLPIIIAFILVISSCNKNDGPEIIYHHSDQVVKYSINIQNNWINEYSKFINGVLDETTVFNNYDTLIEKITVNQNGELKSKIIYTMEENGFASTSIDTIISLYNTTVLNTTYTYENNFLVLKTINYWIYNQGNLGDSGIRYFSRSIKNENVSSQPSYVPYWATANCTDRFSYSNTLNLIDVDEFTNGILGKINKNLSSYVLLEDGCPCTSNHVSGYNDFQYEMFENGFVKKMIKKHTPCHSASAPETVIGTVYTTIYEYTSNP
jgi:hypothetical protein